MTALLDGKALAATMRAELAGKVTAFAARHGRAPALAVVLVGDDPASHVYVASKVKQTAEIGMRSVEHRLDASCTEAELLALVDALNADPAIDGLLVQLPLPPQINAASVLNRIDPAKDVDGFHPVNAGKLAIGEAGLVPCTPLGAVALAKLARADLAGLHAVVIGRSNIVGKPVAQLLLQENCTVTIAHSRTMDLPGLCRSADLLVAAIGRPNFVTAEFVKRGAIIIDVGINRVMSADGKARLVGDVDFAAAAPLASAITPVPGGVGPMTIAFLLSNTLRAASLRLG
ncbi:MAG: bifunctional methylenetetrahydrofolate dehydrogenase/methenyltetrahydrofolate cyclohydrolase FolD [Beijerinckiaceae bacterium]|jgi:methylenetetrahydrofolate dehydrogenase (NADP+)/methenyltetrahydrofolate cyclohydrolase|nr:bifunctional methylenetetrahydrofolate dehydrogenase/methenyltetrahydrofolate cyclohydrolase FolD [Beijerinckiaceae bacterium]